MRTPLRILVASVVVAWSSCAVQAAPFAFIAGASDDTVTVIDTATNAAVATGHGVGMGVYGVAVHPNGLRAYFTNNYANANAVSVFDTTTYRRVATIRVGAYPVGVAANAAGTRVYVANMNSDTISAIDTTTNAVVATFSACAKPRGLAVNSAGTRIYVMCWVAGGANSSLAVIDAASGTLITTVTVGASAPSPGVQGIVVSPSGTRVYVPSSGSNTLAVIDTASNTVVATVAVGSGPTGVAVNPAGTRAYVTNYSSNTVSVIDTETNTVIGTVAVGWYPAGVSTDPAGTRVYVVNVSSPVSVIDTANNAVVATVPVARDSYPQAIGQFIGGQAPPPSASPVPGPAVQVAAGGWAMANQSHTCAVVAGGGVKCWGNNRDGQLGDGTYASSSRPVDVVGLSFPAASVATGTAHSCAVSTAGAVRCWGDGNRTPVDVVGLSSGVATVAAGWRHSCALTTSGTVWCWGNNDRGQLGDGTLSSRDEARPVSGLSGVVGIAVGRQTSAAVTGDGRVKSWGIVRWNMVCQGNVYCIANPVESDTPTDAPSLPRGVTAISISPSDDKACALGPGGRVWCWECGFPSSPTEVNGLAAGVTAISVGELNACALVSGGNALCWGAYNNSDQPTTPVSGLPSGLIGIAAGGSQMCALTAAGDVMCWGRNDDGQLGDGTTIDRLAPVTVITSQVPNHQGMWYAPAESGWGINFTHQGEIIFATWFTYDTTGKAWWLTMTAQQQADGSFAGPIDLTAGPPFNAKPWDPARVTHNTVGMGRLTFADTNNGTFTYTVNGIAQIKPLARFQFANPVPTCTFNSALAPAQATNYQDMWAVPDLAESGWGINFTHQGDTIFASWFTYDFNGNPYWVTATLGKTAARTYAGALDATTGPPFNALPFDPMRVTHSSVGTGTVTFTDGANGTFVYTLNGVSQTKALTRFVFRTPGTVCQ